MNILPGWIEVRKHNLSPEEKILSKEKINSSINVFNLLKNRMKHLLHEEMVGIYVDGNNNLRGLSILTIGDRNGCYISIPKLFQAGCVLLANGIILVHNHPSGDPSPSQEDMDLTFKAREAGDILGIPILDHIIIAEDQYSSMLDKGILP